MSGLDKLPPQAIEAEQVVLGSILISRGALDDVQFLRPEDFYHHHHAAIYRAALDVAAQNIPVDLVTVSQILRDRRELDEVGGYPYLMDLAASIPSAASAPHYANIVRRKAQQREVIRICRKGEEIGFDDEITDHADQVSGLMMQLVSQDGDDDGTDIDAIVSAVEGQIDQAREWWDLYHGTKIPGLVMTGIYDLDGFIRGLERKTTTIIAARPSMGKSALAVQIALNIAKGLGTGEPEPVVIFALEMPKEAVIRRLIAALSGVDSELIRIGYLSDTQRKRIAEAGRDLSRLPVRVFDLGNASVPKVRAVCRKFKAKHKGRLGAVVVDYIGLMSGPDGGDGRNNSNNRTQEVSQFSRGLKNLWSELDCVGLVLAQLNRNLEGRPDKRPMLSDLRESGSLEQDAHMVALLYRDDYYNDASPDKGICEVGIDKNRDGKTGTVKLFFEKETVSFHSLTQTPTIPEPDFPPGSMTVAEFKAKSADPPPAPPFTPPEPRPFVGTEVQAYDDYE